DGDDLVRVPAKPGAALPGRDVPERRPAVVARAREEAAVGAPRDGAGLARVALERRLERAALEREDAQRSILASAGDAARSRREHGTAGVDRAALGARRDVEDAHGPVAASGRDPPAVRPEGDGLERRRVAAEADDVPAAQVDEEGEARIGARHGDRLAVGREG